MENFETKQVKQQMKLDCINLANSILERREPDMSKTLFQDSEAVMDIAGRYYKFITEN